MVASGDDDGTQLLLEPDRHPAVRPFKDALIDDGIPFTSFGVDDVAAEYARLRGRDRPPEVSVSPRAGRPAGRWR